MDLTNLRWQSIDTATKNGRNILASDGKEVKIICWTNVYKGTGDEPEDDWCISDSFQSFDGGYQRFEPIHWMDLPKPLKRNKNPQ